MPVSFEAGVEDAFKRKRAADEAKHVMILKARVAAERKRLKNNQVLIQMFLGWVCVCVLAWYTADKTGGGMLFGIGKTLASGPASAVTFNTLGLNQEYTFPTYTEDKTLARTKLNLVAAGTKRAYIFMPIYTIGLYLREDKVADLVSTKSLSTLAVPPASSANEHSPFLALKMTFTKDAHIDDTITPILKSLEGARNSEYRQAVDLFKNGIYSELTDNNNLKKNDIIEFMYFGPLKLGISVQGQAPVFVTNADLRRRLLNIFAGDKSVCPELPATLHKAYL